MKNIILVAVAALLLGCGGEDTFELSVGSAVLNVEVVDTDETRSRGLMFRESMAEDHGMLFVFDSLSTRSFYMRNTSIPLSIAYIDDRFVIREIHNMEPFSEEPIVSLYPAMYALEVNEGAFDRLGVGTGARIRLSGELQERLR